MSERIRYKEGYKYQLVTDYWIETDIFGFDLNVDDFIYLLPTGTLIMKRGYAWDGASGPTYDSKSSMRASLVHDALYQLMGEYPDLLEYRLYADELLYRICRQDGMWPFRAYLWKKAVNWFGENAAMAEDVILEAP
jgi:hypothetical protein